jgi:hypothetical protein
MPAGDLNIMDILYIRAVAYVKKNVLDQILFGPHRPNVMPQGICHEEMMTLLTELGNPFLALGSTKMPRLRRCGRDGKDTQISSPAWEFLALFSTD